MITRRKIIGLIVVVLIGTITLSYLAFSSILSEKFASLEETDTKENITQFLQTFSDDLTSLKQTAQDYSVWDSSYEFVQNRNEAFITDNLAVDSLAKLHLNIIAFINTSDELVYGLTIGQNKETSNQLPKGLLPQLINGNRLIQQATTSIPTISGVVILPDPLNPPLLLVFSSILPNSGTGSSGGSLVMGYYLDEVALASLSRRTHVSITIQDFAKPDLLPDFQSVHTSLALSEEAPLTIRPLNEKSIAGYTILRDIYNKPTLFVRVELPRTIYQQGLQAQDSFNKIVLLLFLVSLIPVTMAVLILEKGLWLRLNSLNENLFKIGSSSNLSGRLPVTGKDELAQLTKNINKMLSDLELTQLNHLESEKKYRTVVESIKEVVFQTDEKGYWSFLNPAWTELTGFSVAESIGKPYLHYVHPEDLPKSEQLFQALTSREKEAFQKEIRFLTKDNSFHWVNFYAGTALNRNDLLAGVFGTIIDVTEQKLTALLERDRNDVLEMVATNQPLPLIFNQIILMIESQIPFLSCSIILRDESKLGNQTAPSISEKILQTSEELEIELLNEIGTATDITNGSNWIIYRKRKLNPELRPLWSLPIVSAYGHTLGFYVIYQNPQDPQSPHSRSEHNLLELAVKLASIAIEQDLLSKQLTFQARHDSLTGLPNRLLFEEHLRRTIDEAQQTNSLIGLLFIDLDRFKLINDSLGHYIGDLLLQMVAQRLENCLRDHDMVARMGGDEFTLVLTNLQSTQEATQVARRVIEQLEAPFNIQSHTLHITTSIGISFYPTQAETDKDLLRKADSAMYLAKEQGRNNYQIFNSETISDDIERLNLEYHLSKALENKEITLYYQPQIELVTGKLVGMEALARWHSPELGLIPPTKFIPIAEENGLIIQLGKWVLEEACRQNQHWEKSGYGKFKIAVNVSILQLKQLELVETVKQILEKYELEPWRLEIELTESLLMSNFEKVIVQLEKFRNLGVGIAIDDFGTGYSSLSYLHLLPIGVLKI
ncbi:MAG: diguanylate cyclase, partial [Chloroflexi bacterium]|nr:diguanylate cyclase [Chloroflexota bacterium]